MEKFLLTNDEKQELNSSLCLIADNMEQLVVHFYQNFLHEKNLKLIKQNTNESLINMFSSSLSMIISQIEHPFSIQEYFRILLMKHPDFITMMEDKNLFQQSLMNALIDVFGVNYSERLGNLWYRAVSNYINEFENYIND